MHIRVCVCVKLGASFQGKNTRLRMLENKVLRRIYGRKTKIRKEGLQTCTLKQIKMTRLRRKRWWDI